MVEEQQATAPAAASFEACVDALTLFLQQRDAIVQRIDTLLNFQKKPAEYQQDRRLLSRLFQDCFVTTAGLAHEPSLLDGQLEQARRASGFTPRTQPGNDVIDPVQMLLRALHLWRQTRWPGQKGRLRYAQTLFNLYLLRCLALLTLRLWDAGPDCAARLARLQEVLDQLWQRNPDDQPRLVRDVRWLIPVALSPTTDELGGYFTVAANIAQTFTTEDRLETQKAWVQTGAGHLCSQLRHLSVQRNLALDAPELMLLTRRSNALDLALLVEGLVTLLEAYAQCLQQDEAAQRQALAGAILQGFAPDPELFVNHSALLGPYSMIETLFVATDVAGHCTYTPAGSRHLQLLQRYDALLVQLAGPLLQDCAVLRRPPDSYSPLGALYGFSSNLLELIAFKTLQLDSDLRYGLEDVFAPGDASKRDWVNAWRRLPHVKADLVQQYAYPQDFVDALIVRIEQALQRRAAGPDTCPVAGRLKIKVADGPVRDQALLYQADLPLHCILSSDPQLVTAGGATHLAAGDLQHCRMEGEFLVSYPTAGGWVALSKDLLASVLGAGLDVTIGGLPPSAAGTLCLMCTGLADVTA